MRNPQRDVISHYSDPRTASAYHDDRYGGPIGLFFLAEETRQFRALVRRCGRGARIIDVGAGTGKLSDAVDAHYVAMDRSIQMLGMFRRRDPSAPVVVGDAQALPFRSGSVDVICASRVLMHLPDWPQMVAESCRVARRAVILDYPVSPSLAALEPRVWRLCRRDSHPPHRVFAIREVRRAFARHGFRQIALHRGFVLPYRLHRMLGLPGFSRWCEQVIHAIGLSHLLGSPVFAAFAPAGADAEADA